MFSKADIRNPLRYLLMNAVASRSVSGSFQLPLTEASSPHPPLSAPRTLIGGMLICVQRTEKGTREVKRSTEKAGVSEWEMRLLQMLQKG